MFGLCCWLLLTCKCGAVFAGAISAEDRFWSASLARISIDVRSGAAKALRQAGHHDGADGLMPNDGEMRWASIALTEAAILPLQAPCPHRKGPRPSSRR